MLKRWPAICGQSGRTKPREREAGQLVPGYTTRNWQSEPGSGQQRVCEIMPSEAAWLGPSREADRLSSHTGSATHWMNLCKLSLLPQFPHWENGDDDGGNDNAFIAAFNLKIQPLNANTHFSPGYMIVNILLLLAP